MSQTKGKIIDHFYGGIIRDEKTRIDGAALNVEELDIFENANFVRAAQVMTRVAASSSSPSSSPSSSTSAGASNSASPSNSPSNSPSASASNSPSASASSSDYDFGTLDYVGGASTASAGSSSLTLSLTALTGGLASAPAEDDIVILSFAQHIAGDANLAPTTSGYTELADLYTSDEGDLNMYVGYKVMGVTPDTTVTVPSQGTGSLIVAVHVWRNVDTTTPIDATTTTATGVDTVQADPASITPVTSGAVVIVVGASASDTTNSDITTVPSGYTVEVSRNTSASRECGLVVGAKAWAGGAENPGVFTGTTSTDSKAVWGAVTIALRPASPVSNSASPSSSPSSSPSTSQFPQDQTEINAYCGDNEDNTWGYGVGTSNEVQIFKLTTGGADAPGAFSLIKISTDTTNLGFSQSPLAYHQTTEVSNPNSIYYLKKNGTSVYLVRYNIGANAEQRWTGSAWSASGALDANTQLTGLNGSHDRYFMRVEFGELYIGNGNKIAKVDDEGALTLDAFTLPVGWEAVDIAFVSDVGLILARNVNRLANYCKAYWWDLTSTVQFDNQITIPHGGPQWIVNFKERLYAMCAQNGVARFYSSVASPGVPLVQIPGMELADVASETSTQEISSPKMMATKDNILYFGLYKNDKSGIYAIGNIDEDKPTALCLAKRFDTTDYSRHTPIALHTQGPNFYASYEDNGAFKHSRCESNNSPDRSSNAIYESVVFDEGDPTKNKDIIGFYILSKPLATNTSIATYIKSNYGSYVRVFQEDGTDHSIGGSLLGNMRGKSITGKTHQFKFQLTSNGTDSPIVTGLAYVARVSDLPAHG